MRFLFVFLILLIAGIASAYFYFQPSSHWFQHPSSSPTPIASNPSVCEALHVVTPQPNQTIASPLEIEVIVDNSQKECRWTVFEAEAGTVELKTPLGETLAQGTLRTTENWMTTDPVHYTAKISFTKPINILQVELVFTEENPSGESTPQVVKIPLNL